MACSFVDANIYRSVDDGNEPKPKPEILLQHCHSWFTLRDSKRVCFVIFVRVFLFFYC